jgi:hypothetical protein
LPAFGENNELSIRLTQITLASSINGTVAPAGSNYILAVFTIEVRNGKPAEVNPIYLSLVTQGGEKQEPLAINVDYPETRFYPQTIEPEHGTSVLVVFDIPQKSQINHFLYAWPSDDPLILYIDY